jgi:flavin-dependent dehydrogenase
MRPQKKRILALQAEVACRNPSVLEGYKGSVHMDLGSVPRGYGWVFPKKDHLSVGVLSGTGAEMGLKRMLKKYMGSKGLEREGEILLEKGHTIPRGTGGRARIANEKGLLVGDAAGFGDPVTGEGISYALMEAEMASRVIQGVLAQGAFEGLLRYERLVNEALRSELRCAERIGFLLYRIPALGVGIVKAGGRRLGRFYEGLLNGEKTYCELEQKLFWLPTLLLAMAGRDRSRS